MNPLNQILQGDCIDVMKALPAHSVDFVLTDPPYLCNYRSREGRTVRNDRTGEWLLPAFTEMHRLLKPDACCVSFYGWHKADEFIAAWRAAGFRLSGHIVFRKRYASSTRFMGAEHEQAYLLTKGNPAFPDSPIPDVIDWHYTGNRLHPTQKPVKSLEPLIESFCPPGGVVLDPFCGSGSSLMAAKIRGRHFIGIELDRRHHRTATQRLRVRQRIEAAAA